MSQQSELKSTLIQFGKSDGTPKQIRNSTFIRFPLTVE